MEDMLQYEKLYINEGYKFVCGVDEAGRGPLAGPVYAAAVIMPIGVTIEGVNDSKKISEKKRQNLFELIKKEAVSYCVASASESEIDEINILKATHLAMKRAVEGLSIPPDMILVDGNSLPEFKTDAKCIIKGDSLSHSIAAASILAKVSRDNYMCEQAKKYPNYCFEKHKGYGTKLHYEMIEKYGISPIHRKTFLKKVLKSHEQS